MRTWQQEYIDKYYRKSAEWKDIWEIWRDLITAHVLTGARTLEIGPGPSNDASKFLHDVSGYVVGLDVEHDRNGNEWIDELHVYDGTCFPFPDQHFDVVVSRWVNEHLTDPKAHFRDIYRVLAAGGGEIRIPDAKLAPLHGYVLPHHTALVPRAGSQPSQEPSH